MEGPSNKDNRHRKRILPSMEEKWWHSEETDRAATDDSGSEVNEEPLRPPPDKDFTTGPRSVISVIVVSLVLGLPAIIFIGAGVALMAFSIMNPNHEDTGLGTIVCIGIPLLLFGFLPILILLDGLSRKRLRVQHSVDRLVYEESFFGLVLYSKERPLSEAAYLKYTKTQYQSTDGDGNSTTSTSRTYIVHGHSSEEGEWEISIEDLILQSGDHRRKAREIADVIGIEFRK